MQAGFATRSKYWSSYDAMGVGPLSLMEIPLALSALGDGVIRGDMDELAVAAGAGNTVTVARGSALIAGIPYCNYTADTLTFTRPVASTRIDRVVIRFYGDASATPGKAELAWLTGTDTKSGAALYEVSLAQVTIPVVAPIVVDERAFSGARLSDQDVVRASSATTTHATGEALSGLSVTMVKTSGDPAPYYAGHLAASALPTSRLTE
jgi:hypothetical protein